MFSGDAGAPSAEAVLVSEPNNVTRAKQPQLYAPTHPCLHPPSSPSTASPRQQFTTFVYSTRLPQWPSSALTRN
ncbi:hypothetical protein A0H81_12344 [Grifola frondosa]|uniref:Uncharacterized protein n=1 Tax=Grifola frondosa TaxID=5627 RepID=A0A1C7LSX2_GRIFR|nr:hypothetical protein A0H81_12344 [Grifola frondosa]